MRPDIKKIFIALGVIFAAVALSHVVSANFFKAFFTLILSAMSLLWAFFSREIKAYTSHGFGRALKLIFILALCAMVLGISFLYFYGVNDNPSYDEDAVIILGAGLKGKNLSLTLKNRLDKGLEYAERNKNAKIIVTGGQGHGEDITEAEAMRLYLISKGIDEDRIISEDKATSTYENLMFSSAFLSKGDRVVIITDGFHIFRSVSMAKMFDLVPTHMHSKSYRPQLPLNFIRELAAVSKMLVFGH